MPMHYERVPLRHIQEQIARGEIVEMMGGEEPEIPQEPAAPEGEEVRYPWQQAVHAALLELNQQKLRGKIAAAEKAVADRIQALAQAADNAAERRALADALSSLRVLKRNPSA